MVRGTPSDNARLTQSYLRDEFPHLDLFISIPGSTAHQHYNNQTSFSIQRDNIGLVGIF